MAKTTAPLLSFSAAGQVGKTQVYARWRGRSYVRRYVTPFNPQTTAQTEVRGVFSFLNAVYKLMPSISSAPWEAYASGKPLIGRNAFMKFNLAAMQSAVDCQDMVFSPGALGGLPPTAVVVTPGNDQLAIAVTAPTVLPSGWTITAAQVAVLPDQDPHGGTLTAESAGQDTTDPYSVTLTGLRNAQLYVVGAWLKWLRPDGKIAYSPSLQSTGLTT